MREVSHCVRAQAHKRTGKIFHLPPYAGSMQASMQHLYVGCDSGVESGKRAGIKSLVN